MAPNPHKRNRSRAVIQRYEPKVRLDRLATHPENPRQGDVAAIAASIETNGFYGAVVAQKSSGHVLAGNHRLLAARERGDTVLDLFGGSGSTLVAAHTLRRQAFLMELDPRFVDVICRRWQRLTGSEPVHATTGRAHNFDR